MLSFLSFASQPKGCLGPCLCFLSIKSCFNAFFLVPSFQLFQKPIVFLWGWMLCTYWFKAAIINFWPLGREELNNKMTNGKLWHMTSLLSCFCRKCEPTVADLHIKTEAEQQQHSFGVVFSGPPDEYKSSFYSSFSSGFVSNKSWKKKISGSKAARSSQQVSNFVCLPFGAGQVVHSGYIITFFVVAENSFLLLLEIGWLVGELFWYHCRPWN